MPGREIDEVLEIIWTEREKAGGYGCSCERHPDDKDVRSGENDCAVSIVRQAMARESLPDVLSQMQTEGLIAVSGDRVGLTATGEKAASDLIRRHRLAERLLVDVLETGDEKLEVSACHFEHILSDEVSNAICTLLGHPRECPHGLKIPAGKCCTQSQSVIASVVASLDQLAVGEKATIAYILTHQHPRLHKLMSFGIAPGVRIRMHQKSPTYVIQVEETQIALEKDIANNIYVRRK